jgi:antitoxin VapB
MRLNVKNEEAHRLARELATLTGENISCAVTEALRERLERVKGAQNASLSEHLLAIGKDCAARLNERYLSIDHAELLYADGAVPQ